MRIAVIHMSRKPLIADVWFTVSIGSLDKID